MRFLRACFAFGCLILGSRQSFGGDPQWVEIRSPNFSVITDAGDKRGRDVALHFEQMRSVFGTLMTRAHVNLSVPLQIVAFHSSKEMREMAPVFNGKPTEVAGLFQSGQDRTFIMLDMSVENPWSVVFHEYAHQLMNSNLSMRADPWFEEGFAEYFASIQVDNKQVSVGKIPEDTYRILQQMGMMPVAQLLRVQQYSTTYNESGSHRTVFYAESSLLVHYIYDNHLIPKLADYFDARVTQKKTVEQAVQEAFGTTPEQFDKTLRNYLNSNRFRYYPIPTPPGIVAAQFSETPVSLADAHAVLADIDAHSLDHHDRALDEFRDVLKIDPGNAAALRGIGYCYLQKRDYEHAGEYFRQAAERDSEDPRVHYYNALLMSRGGPIMRGGDVEAVKKELETAVALDPKLADAYSLLAFAQAFSGEPEKALANIKKAVELAPRNEEYQFSLANVYMANRQVDQAIEVLRVLAASGNPSVSNHANAALLQAESFKERSKSFQPQIETRTDTNPVVRNSDNVLAGRVEAEIHGDGPPPPVHFIKGKLSAVDCSRAPLAWLSVISEGRDFKLRVSNTDHLVLFGADKFSCDWKNKSVAVNYREPRDNGRDGDVVSLELQ
jgi:Tfp pilus assembly protein PilF